MQKERVQTGLQTKRKKERKKENVNGKNYTERKNK